MPFESTKQGKSIALQEFIRSDAFKKQYGDWEKGESSLVLGEDGEPLVLWHGSPNKFGAFNLSHAGENTGITEYTLKSTGEKTVSDSSKTIFFTDNRQLAASYAFLARTQTLGRIQSHLTDIGALLNSPEGTFLSHIHSLEDFRDTVRELRKENDAELNAILDKLPDLDGKNPISSMPEAEREALAKEFFAVRDNYAEMYRMNNIGGISNRLNNVLKMQEYLPYFKENFKRLCGNDTFVLTIFGEDFTKYDMSFYSGEESSGRSIHVFRGRDDKRMMASGFRQEPVYLDTLSASERKELLDKIDSDLAQCIKEYNRDIKKAGFEEGTHLYPVFLKASRPLVHDYQGSSFPDKYKPNEKYGTAYVAARQSAKAIRDGYDAVIYKNIRDPFLGTTYGVFSTDNIVMIDRSLMREEELSPRLEGLPDSSLAQERDIPRSLMEVEKYKQIKTMENKEQMQEDQRKDWSGEPLMQLDRTYYDIEVKEFYGDMGFTFEESPDTLSRDIRRLRLEAANCIVNTREEDFSNFIYEIRDTVRNEVIEVHVDSRDASDEFLAAVREWYGEDIRISQVPENQKYMDIPPVDESMVQYNREKDAKEDATCRLIAVLKSRKPGQKVPVEPVRVLDRVYTEISWHKGTDGGRYYNLVDNHGFKTVGMNEDRLIAFLNNAADSIRERKAGPEVTFIEDDSPYYKVRTKRNAEAADVTIAFAADFTTAGERCTRNVAGDRYIAVTLPSRRYFNAPESDYAKVALKGMVEKIEAGIMELADRHGFSPTDVNVNVAGNGNYTLKMYGISQADVDRFVTDAFRLMESRPNVHVSAIRSGGQTGVDEAGIKAAATLGIPATVLAPQGWKFRGADGRDVSDEATFKARFSSMKEARAEKVAERKEAAVGPDLRIVSRGGKYNYVGGDGKALCSVWLDSAEPFRNGRALCVVGNTQFEIDTKGIILKKETIKNGISRGI